MMKNVDKMNLSSIRRELVETKAELERSQRLITELNNELNA